MDYIALLQNVKERIKQAQMKALLSVNAELLAMYWDVGRIIDSKKAEEGWGASVIPRLAQDIRNELAEVKGFSERNLKRMLAFYREYNGLAIGPTALAKMSPQDTNPFGPPLVAQLEKQTLCNYVNMLPWAHNVALLRVKNMPARLWYMQQTLEHGWSKDWLTLQIKSSAYER